MSIEHLLNLYRFNLKYAYRLTENLDEDQMTFTPSLGLENHPAWTIGHLVTGSAMVAKILGGTYEVPKGYDDLFRLTGPGDKRMPSKDLEKYPPKKTLLGELARQHELVEKLIFETTNSSPERLAEEINWRFAPHLPTVGYVVYFMCLTHEDAFGSSGSLAQRDRIIRKIGGGLV